MVKASELRIGNLIQSSDKITPVFHLDSDEDGFRINYTYDSEVVFSGIDITEEWLIKAGFEKEENDAPALSVWYEYWKEGFDIFTTGTEGGAENEFCYGTFDNRIYYIHQLQNLYFALTGEELTFNL